LILSEELWRKGGAPIVKTYGKGALYLLSISDNKRNRHILGRLKIPASEYTEILVGFSHYYHKFVFYWDGRDKATYETEFTKPRSLGDMDKAVQVDRDGHFSNVQVVDLKDPKKAEHNETTLYIIRRREEKRSRHLSHQIGGRYY
jgi:hypothetical protein